MRGALPFTVVSLLAGAMATQAGQPQIGPDKGGNQLLSDVTECRKVAEPAARLQCYDSSVAKLADASAKQDVVVLDREAVRKTKRSLFGFSLPPLPFFENGGDKDKVSKEEFTEIEAKIQSARLVGLHEWTIVLDDGSVWQATESPESDPRSGNAIRIRKAAMGSYFGNIAGQRAVRMHRIG